MAELLTAISQISTFYLLYFYTLSLRTFQCLSRLSLSLLLVLAQFLFLKDNEISIPLSLLSLSILHTQVNPVAVALFS